MLMAGGLTPKSRAMVGSAVASTVASSCSMNMALATIRAMVRKLGSAGAETAGSTNWSDMVGSLSLVTLTYSAPCL